MTSETKAKSGQETCPVVDVLKLLQQSFVNNTENAARRVIAHSTRLVTEISLGRGTLEHLFELNYLTKDLAEVDPSAASVLSSSLANRQEAWQQHVIHRSCPVNTCVQPNVAPCHAACPAHIDIPSMMAHVGLGQYDESLAVLLADSPLPNSCGLVCPAPCENVCVQNSISKASVLIKPMKSVAARCANGYPLPDLAPSTGKKVAVIGSGPAGLTTAYNLAKKGHQVEVFDEREQIGGVMRYGIPTYRLPAEVLDEEINMVKAIGVKFHNGQRIENLKEFLKQGFDATFLATGLQKSRGLGIPGEEQPFVLGGMDFLSAVEEGKNPQVGPHVIVIGGGNAAIDVAMMSLRQGATKVEMWYRRTRKEMPANPHEVVMAFEEGVELVEHWQPVQILPDNQIEFSRSRNAPDAATAENVIVRADHIIAGIGQVANLEWIDGTDIELEWGNIVVDPVTLQTGEKGVFSGGDIALGAATVVEAIGSGKRAAESINAYLMDVDMDHESLVPRIRSSVPAIPSNAQTRTLSSRPHVPEADPIARRTSHAPIDLGLSAEVAKKEVERCLRCDQCIGCGLCELACAEVGANALQMVDVGSGRKVFDGYLKPATMCIGCGACAAVCPTKAITVADKNGDRVTMITGTEVRRQELVACDTCGTKYATEMQLAAMRKALKLDQDSPCICPSCLRMRSGNSLHGMRWS